MRMTPRGRSVAEAAAVEQVVDLDAARNRRRQLEVVDERAALVEDFDLDRNGGRVPDKSSARRESEIRADLQAFRRRAGGSRAIHRHPRIGRR